MDMSQAMCKGRVGSRIVHAREAGALDVVAAGAGRWAIVDTLYFDAGTHRFVRGDIEIDDSRIGRVLPPGSSRRAVALPGDKFVCLPGLIDADIGVDCQDWSACSQELLLHGVTTAGTFCPSLPDCRCGADDEGMRRLLYVELGGGYRIGESVDVAPSELERFEHAVRVMTSSRRRLFPAVVPRQIWSAQTLMTVASLSESLARRLCVRLCSTTREAQSYKETRFFTEVGLLSYLSLLTHATIFNLSQIARGDVAMLNESSVNIICAPGAVSPSLIKQHYAPLSLKERAMGFAIDRSESANANWFASLIILSMALVNRSDDIVQTCDTVVDSLTRSAALALGIGELGAIAGDMKADLCLFDRPPELGESCDSLSFIKLFAGARPRHVLIDGLPAVVEGACACEPAF